jgi:hypothetical protein
MPMSLWIAGMMQALPGLTLEQLTVDMNALQVRTLALGLSQLQQRQRDEWGRMKSHGSKWTG